MKKRIISSVLVVVMLVLSLVSCGYSYTDDDLSQYMTFDKAAFDKALEALDYEDGKFTSDDATRDKKVDKYIYDLLEKKIDSDQKLTDGKLGKLDKLYYRYYVTFKDKAGNDVVFYAEKMQKSNSTTFVQLGNNELVDDKGEIRSVILGLIEDGKLDDMKDYIYAPDNTSSKDTTKAGVTAYITYTKTWTEKVDGKDKEYKETHTYEKVTLGDKSNFAAEKLVGSTVGTTLKTKDKDGKEIDATFENTEGGVKYTYSGLKVNWVVPFLKDKDGKDTKETAKEIIVDYKTTVKITLKDTDLVVVNSKWTEKEKKAVTEIPANTDIQYHIYPAYFQTVNELDADIILKEFLGSLPMTQPEEGSDEEAKARELASLKEATEELKAVKEKLSAFEDAESAYDSAVTAREDAEEALKKLDEKKDPEGYNAAKEQVTTKQGEEKTKKDDMEEAEKALNESLAAVYKKVNSKDPEAAKKTIIDEYKKAVRDVLTEEYNEEIKNNIAKAVWKLLSEDSAEKYIKITSRPRKAVREAYDRMFEMHEAIFYTKSDTNNKSFYSTYNGEFEKYLIETMKTESNWSDAKDRVTDYTMAKHALWALAEEYVDDIMIIYFVSEKYEGVLYTEDEIKDFKNDDDGYFDYYKDSQGETNLLAAYQFDALMDYFLEVEKKDGKTVYDEKTGAPKYVRIIKKGATGK